MDKKIILAIFILLLAILSLIFFVYKPFFHKSATPISQLDRITGRIVGIKDNNISIETTVQSIKNKKIEVTVTPSTVITKVVYAILKNVKSGESYTPETKRTQITISDLFVDMTIYVQTKENLLTSDKITALNIVYETFDQQK